MTAARDSLGVAVVGAGAIARAWHLPEWAKRPDAHVVWVADVDEAAASGAAESVAAKPTTTLAAVLDDPEVDAVDVCTPVDTHAELTRAALAAGKHVLVEKPAASSVEDVAAMATAADAAGVVAMVAENWLYCPGGVRAKRLLDSGELGELLSIVVALETGAALTREPPRSFLLDPGVHAVNVVRWLAGEPTHVSAFTLPDRAGADSGAVISLRLGDSAVGSLHLSGRAQRPRPGRRLVRVLGTEGLVEFDVFEGWVEWGGPAWRGGPRHRWHDPHASRGAAEELDQFVAAIRGAADPRPSMWDQVRTHRLLDAIRRSARDLSTVEVS